MDTLCPVAKQGRLGSQVHSSLARLWALILHHGRFICCHRDVRSHREVVIKGTMVAQGNWGVGLQHSNLTPAPLWSSSQLGSLSSHNCFPGILFLSVHLQLLPREAIVSTFSENYIYGKDSKFHRPFSHRVFLSFCSSFSIFFFNGVKW